MTNEISTSNANNSEVRQADQKLRMRAVHLSVTVSVVLLTVKMLTFYLTGSSAVLSDALESIINVVASSFALLSIWMAAKPPDADHPYGHGKIEYFSAGFEGALIVGAAVGIFYSGISHLLNPRPLSRLGVGLILLGVAAVVNLMMGIYLIRTGKRTQSITLTADGKHLLTDVYTSAGVLIALALIAVTGWLWLDGAVACLVGINILITGGKLVKHAYARLMDASEPELLDRIADVVAENHRGDWVDIHQLRAWRAGILVHIDLHLVLPQNLSLEDAHKEAKFLENLLINTFAGNAEVLVHTDPCDPAKCPICGRPGCDLRSGEHDHTPYWNRNRLTRSASHILPEGRPSPQGE
jgi:cation diffusion facilitator family transporter